MDRFTDEFFEQIEKKFRSTPPFTVTQDDTDVSGSLPKSEPQEILSVERELLEQSDMWMDERQDYLHQEDPFAETTFGMVDIDPTWVQPNVFDNDDAMVEFAREKDPAAHQEQANEAEIVHHFGDEEAYASQDGLSAYQEQIHGMDNTPHYNNAMEDFGEQNDMPAYQEPSDSTSIQVQPLDQSDMWMNGHQDYQHNVTINGLSGSGAIDMEPNTFDDDATEHYARQSDVLAYSDPTNMQPIANYDDVMEAYGGQDYVPAYQTNGMVGITHYEDSVEAYAGQDDKRGYQGQTNGMDYTPHAQYDQPISSSAMIPVDSKASSSSPSMSAQEVNNILNADVDANIDTADLCNKVQAAMQILGVSQLYFGKKVLGRCQGTLSDLLNKPKPWASMKPSGRSTYRRMYNWLKQPMETQLAMLKVDDGLKTTAQRGKRQRKLSPSEHDEFSPKRARHVFTEIQKRTLERMYEDDQRPSKELQQIIADHLKLDLGTVANYYLNARRRGNQNKMIQKAH